MWAEIRDESQGLGEIATGYRDWAANVGATGGDDPRKAVDLVFEIVRAVDERLSGKFLWITDGMQAPIDSW
jgi:hypothetical protein